MRSRSSWLIVLLLIMTTIPARATFAMPEPGTRIRVTARVPERQRWIGPFVSVAGDTLTMRNAGTNDTLVTVPTMHIMRFEISRGNGPNGLRGAGWGFATGALLGAAVGYESHSDNNNDFFVTSAGQDAAVAAVVIGVVGAAIGGAIGALTHSEHWRVLPLENPSGTANP